MALPSNKTKHLKHLISSLPAIERTRKQNNNQWVILMDKEWNKRGREISKITKQLFEKDKDCAFFQTVANEWCNAVGEMGDLFWISSSPNQFVNASYGYHIPLGRYPKHSNVPKQWYYWKQIRMDFSNAQVEIWESTAVRNKCPYPRSHNPKKCIATNKTHYHIGYIVLTNLKVLEPKYFVYGPEVEMSANDAAEQNKKQFHITLAAFGVEFENVDRIKVLDIVKRYRKKNSKAVKMNCCYPPLK